MPSYFVKPQRMAGSQLHFECRSTRLVQLKNKEGLELRRWLVVGEVVGIHIETEMLEDGIHQTARAHPIFPLQGLRGLFRDHREPAVQDEANRLTYEPGEYG